METPCADTKPRNARRKKTPAAEMLVRLSALAVAPRHDLPVLRAAAVVAVVGVARGITPRQSAELLGKTAETESVRTPSIFRGSAVFDFDGDGAQFLRQRGRKNYASPALLPPSSTEWASPGLSLSLSCQYTNSPPQTAV